MVLYYKTGTTAHEHDEYMQISESHILVLVDIYLTHTIYNPNENVMGFVFQLVFAFHGTRPKGTNTVKPLFMGPSDGGGGGVSGGPGS